MMNRELKYEIITFYEFKDLGSAAEITTLKERFRELMTELSIRGTVILAPEGFNSTVGGERSKITEFIDRAGKILRSDLTVKSSFHGNLPFRRIKVKIKPEIITLRKSVDISAGDGTHVDPKNWNTIIEDPATIVLDARNDYEHRTGSFRNAVNPKTEKFNDLPEFVARNLDPKRHRKIAMYCTGGIRCEKFAPYMKRLGFQEVYQLEGGILKYLEVVKPEESLWEGECFVFDDRITVDESLRKGTVPDYSQLTAGDD